MTPETWNKVRTLVEGALALPEAERAAWLAAQTQDAEVLGEAKHLLLFEREASEIFAQEMPSWDAVMPRVESDLAGATIGRYRLVEEIGRGGMGAVYLAERADGTYEQRVALKVLQESIFTGRLTEKFAQERQILARLTHPGIARLLDGGVTPDGRPYLVLEYIDGRTIDRYCAEENLSIEAKLRLFLKVAAAVQSAHQQLVLHLDIKPANILVTAEGEPKLLDFGIARVLSEGLEGSNLAEATMRLLTPKYSSPEQAAGQPLGVGSDVFSLATLLYRLLTGRLPYNIDGASALEAARMVREEMPIAPSKAAAGAVADRLRGDLDNILLQALRKEPPRRYGTVVELADDIRRFLAHQPVRAHADSFAYRAGKFLRRNRIGVMVAAAVTVLVALSVAAVIHSATVARRQEQLAERRFQDVRNLAHSYIFDLDPQLENVPGTIKVRAFVLQNALAYLDAMAAERTDDLDLMRELGKGYMTISGVQSQIALPSLSDPAGSRRSLQKSYALERKVFDRNPNDLAQRTLVVNDLRLLADLARNEADLKSSQQLATDGWNLGQPLLHDPPHYAGLNTMMRIAMIVAQNYGAQSEGPTLGDPKAAIPWLDRLHQLIVQYASLPASDQKPYFADAELRHELMIRASVARQLGNKAEARNLYEQSLIVSARLLGTSSSGTVGDLVNRYTYASFLLETHDPQRASEIAPEAKPVLLLESGANRSQLIQVAGLLAMRARIDVQLHNLTKGKAEMQQCIDSFEALRAQRKDDKSANLQMAVNFFDMGKEPNLDLATQLRLFHRGLEVLDPALAAHGDDFALHFMAAEGLLRMVSAMQGKIKGVTPEEIKYVDQAEDHIRKALLIKPGSREASEMMQQAEDLRAGRRVD